MKKRILALVVCLLLCLPLVLTSCGKFVKQIANTKVEDKASYATAAATVVDGSYSALNSKFLYTKEYDNGDTTHRVYNVLSGNSVWSGDADSSENYNVGFLGDDLFYTAFTDDEGETTYAIYNDAGTALLTALQDTPVALTNFEVDAVVADDKLYFFEEGSLNMKKDLNDTVVDVDVLRQLKTAKDSYVLVNGSKIFVFDEEFTQVDVQTFTSNSKAYYKSEKSESFILDNGNVLVQVKSTVGDYEDVYDANYDYVEDGTCYILDTYIYNTKRMSYKQINLDYIIQSVTTATEYFEEHDCGFVKEADNKATAYKIDNEEVVYGVNNEGDAFTVYLSNKGKVQEFEITDEGTNYKAISDTRYLVNGDYFTRVYNEKNKVVGEIGRAQGYNKNFIYTNKAIYSTDDLSLVVALDEYTSVVGTTVDSIVYKVRAEKKSDVTYYLVTTSGTNAIATDDDDASVEIAVSKYFINLEVVEDGTDQTISVLTTAGNTITYYEADRSKGDNVEFVAAGALDDNHVIVVKETDKDNETEYSFVLLSR